MILSKATTWDPTSETKGKKYCLSVCNPNTHSYIINRPIVQQLSLKTKFSDNLFSSVTLPSELTSDL